MWVLIDNYDSFTYILHHYLLQSGHACMVYRNDALDLNQLQDLNPSRLIISPGPGTPLQAGITMAAIDHFHTRIPILGICLGHQALGLYFGARLQHAPQPMHGKQSIIRCAAGHPLFNGLPGEFEVMRYHSLCINELDGTGLEALAHSTDDGLVQAITHERFACTGIQFHPESVGTGYGQKLILNWALMGLPA
jgi:anthranilate synthase/aminodeoxychorismate synthase-like glutamine amidotransferase